MNTKNQNALANGRTSGPGLIDSLIVFFVAGALALFLLWAATTVMDVRLFERLPGWLENAFSSIWTSVASGAAGIGLAVFRALSERGRPTPNYVFYIGLTTVFLLVLVFAMVFAMSQLAPKKVVKLAPDLVQMPVIDGRAGPAKAEPFEVRTGPKNWIVYRVKGNYHRSGDYIEGNVVQGEAIVAAPPPPMAPNEALAAVSLHICYVKTDFSGEEYHMTPSDALPTSTMKVDMPYKHGAKKAIAPFNFRIKMPEGREPQKAWLCAAAWNRSVGYHPAWQQPPLP